MINIGITEMHGIAQEYCKFPPAGVEYRSIDSTCSIFDRFFTSSALGVLNTYRDTGCDLLEAPLFPILTKEKWIYSPADFPTCANFGVFGAPLPRMARVKILEYLFSRDNFKKLLFKSEIGKSTLHSYAGLTNDKILSKVDVVYPAVREIDNSLLGFRSTSEEFTITFVGNPFFRKGGSHVVDVFEELKRKYERIKLILCSSWDFKTNNKGLAQSYTERIKGNSNISLEFVARDKLFNEILPQTNVFVCPTYSESYGYAIEEAMAFGIPVVATNISAIPEIVEHGVSGFLIDVKGEEFISACQKGIYVDSIPECFNFKVNKSLYGYLDTLIGNDLLRVEMGEQSLRLARSKFSFEVRNQKMSKIYREAVSLEG